MAKVVPVLGAAGFSTDLNIKADEVLSNFYITLRSQSDMFRGSVVSLSDIIARYGNSEIEVARETREKLLPYLERQFDEVNLDVTSSSTIDSIQLQISVILRDGNRSIDIHHVVTSKDSKIRSIIDLQNDGKPIKLADQIIK
ncbi:hypothetical protein D3C85_14360 [compost metagenome]